VNLDIEEEALVTEVVDKVKVIEDKKDTAYLREIMFTAPTTLVSKI
jgi:hypothetical protein